MRDKIAVPGSETPARLGRGNVGTAGMCTGAMLLVERRMKLAGTVHVWDTMPVAADQHDSRGPLNKIDGLAGHWL
jgi:hypothetical protein